MATRKTNRLRSLLPDDIVPTLIVAGALAFVVFVAYAVLMFIQELAA